MDDLTVFGNSFDDCLDNLEKVLKRCVEKELMLNWEKCHYMVTSGIVLGHVVLLKELKLTKQKLKSYLNCHNQKQLEMYDTF